MSLTLKQEKFCQYYFKTENKTKSYRAAYDTENMNSKSISKEASKLYKNPKVNLRIRELKQYRWRIII